jgi:hypothetical protein
MKPAWVQGWRNGGLAARIVGTSLLLLLVVQLAGYGVVRTFIADNARQQIGHELEVGERVWLRVLKQNADKLTLGASVLSADLRFVMLSTRVTWAPSARHWRTRAHV